MVIMQLGYLYMYMGWQYTVHYSCTTKLRYESLHKFT